MSFLGHHREGVNFGGEGNELLKKLSRQIDSFSGGKRI